MERRYLAATLALAATFAVFSGEFCTRYLGKVPHSRAQLKADIACAKQYVAQQLLSKLEPYVGQSDSEPAPMLVEMNVPDLPQAPETPTAAVPPAAPKCPFAARGQKAPQQVIEMRVMAGDAGRRWSDLSVVRAELLSERAQQWQNMVNERTMEINVKALEQAERISARAMAKAQREMEKSRVNMSFPAAPGTPIHINFATPTVVTRPATPEPATLLIY